MYVEISYAQSKNSNSESAKQVDDSKDFITHFIPTQFISLIKSVFR